MDQDLREAARKRIKAKRDFWSMVIIFIIIAILLNGIWWFSGSHRYYWPAWPMVGFALATAFTAFSVYGPGGRPITDEAIEREVRKLKGED